MDQTTLKQQQSTKAAPVLSLANSSNSHGNSYAAVIENRAKEVGVAVLYLDSLQLQISQFIEAGRCAATTDHYFPEQHAAHCRPCSRVACT
jgi:hypothetical protein